MLSGQLELLPAYPTIIVGINLPEGVLEHLAFVFVSHHSHHQRNDALLESAAPGKLCNVAEDRLLLGGSHCFASCIASYPFMIEELLG